MKTKKENQLIHQKISPVYERTIAYLENLMVVACEFTNGPMVAPDPAHSHPHEQITYVAEGELLFFRDGIKYHLSTGDLITVASSVPHCIQTISSYVKLIDSFNPVRKDFLEQV